MTKDLQVGNSSFDQAWLLIKRQTTLGEFHPDLPSPYGEHIAFYHGTTEPNAQKIMADKLRAKRGVHGTGAYVSNDYDNARRYAHAKAVHDKDWQGNKQKPMVLGVREGVFDNLDEPTVTQGTEDWMEEGFFPHGIPPQYLTRLPNDYDVEWGSQFVEKAYEYHGTVDLPSVLQHGIRGGSPKTRSKRYVPESLRAADLVNYTTTDPEAALRFAQERARRTKQDPSKVGVVRMRTADLPEYVEHQEPDYGDLQGGMSRVRQGSIPPEVLQQWS